MPIQVTLVDDHALVRAGLRTLLEMGRGFEVVAEAADGREAVRLIQAQLPDVVVMDIRMKELNGLDATRQVIQACPQVHVLILSMYANEEYVFQALHNGATGYLLKDATAAELERAVRAVARGDIYVSPAVLTPVISGYLQSQRRGARKERGAIAVLPYVLSPRQREVLQLIGESVTTKEIAQRLHLSVKTVESHRTQLMERLNTHNLAGLVRHAVRLGLVDANR
jgi:DNA-binding NarL/FixJ family response regulator